MSLESDQEGVSMKKNTEIYDSNRHAYGYESDSLPVQSRFFDRRE